MIRTDYALQLCLFSFRKVKKFLTQTENALPLCVFIIRIAIMRIQWVFQAAHCAGGYFGFPALNYRYFFSFLDFLKVITEKNYNGATFNQYFLRI